MDRASPSRLRPHCCLSSWKYPCSAAGVPLGTWACLLVEPIRVTARFAQLGGERLGVDWSTKPASGKVHETQKPAVSAASSLTPAGSAALTAHFVRSRLGPAKSSSTMGVPAELILTWLRLTPLPMFSGLLGMMPKEAVRP